MEKNNLDPVFVKINACFRVCFVLAVAAVYLGSMSSCKIFKKAPKEDKVYAPGEELDEIQGRKVFNPETGKYEVVTDVKGKLDTIQWKDASTETPTPIIKDKKETEPTKPTFPSTTIPQTTPNVPVGSVLKPTYNLAVVLPFLTQLNDTMESINPNSQWALHFWGGAKMAFEKLQSEGVQLTVNAVDSKITDQELKTLLDTDFNLRNADLIIGPYRRENVTMVAEFAKKEDIVFVSPYSATSNLSSANPNYIQINPSLETHCKAITRYIRSKYSADQVVLLGKERERSRFEYFQNENFVIDGSTKSLRFRELIVPENVNSFNEEKIKPFINSGRTTVFVVPSWADEHFVINLLRVIDLARGVNQVEVFGMPQWMEFQKVDYDYYEKLSVHVSSANFIDKFNLEVRSFRQNFLAKYGTLPREEAYTGYDITLFMGRMLKKYGTKFQTMLELEKNDYMQMRFDIEPVITPTSDGAEKKPVIDQYENKSVRILKYSNYQFGLAH